MTRTIPASISRRVLVFSKETGGGTGAVLSNIARLAKEGLEISFYFYKKDKLSYFKGKAHYVSKNYPTSDFPSLFKGLYFIQNWIWTFYWPVLSNTQASTQKPGLSPVFFAFF